MTPEQINIAIAEAVGKRLFVIHKINRGYYLPDAHGYTDDVSRAWQVTEEISKQHATGPAYAGEPDRILAEPAPTQNYYGDLNAMHEAEKILQDWVAYRINLSKIVGIGYTPDLDVCDDIKSFVSATAAQRAEAFLRTIGKWDE